MKIRLLFLIFIAFSSADSRSSSSPLARDDSSLDSFDTIVFPAQTPFPAASGMAHQALPLSGSFIGGINRGLFSPVNSNNFQPRLRGFVDSSYASAACPFRVDPVGFLNTQKINNYCSYISGDFSACTGTGETPEQICRVGCAVSASAKHQILSEISALAPEAKQEACKEKVSVIIANAPVSPLSPSGLKRGHQAAGAQVVESTRRRERAQASLDNEANLNCDQGVEGDACDTFANTALSASGIEGLASIFSLDYSRSPSGTFSFLVRSDCESCMRKKYEALASLSPTRRGDNYRSKSRDEKERVVVEFAARKANEALSNYLKFVERNDFINQFFGIEKESCNALAEIRNLKGCTLSSKIVDRMIKDFDGINGQSPIAKMESLVSKLKTNMFNRSEKICGENDYDFDFANFQQSRLILVGDKTFDPMMLVNSETEAEINRCGEQDTNCFVNAMAKTFAIWQMDVPAGRTKEEYARELIIGHMATSPFFRTMIASKSGILAYRSMTPVNPDFFGTVDSYIERNRQKILDAAAADLNQSCQNVKKDLRTALCSDSGNLAENYTGDEVRREIATIINDSARDPQNRYLQLAASCSILKDSRRDLANQNPKVASLASADRHIPAIPFSHNLVSRGEAVIGETAVATQLKNQVLGFEGGVDTFASMTNQFEGEDSCARSNESIADLFGSSSTNRSLTGGGIWGGRTCNDRLSLHPVDPSLPDCIVMSGMGNSNTNYFPYNMNSSFNTGNSSNPFSFTNRFGNPLGIGPSQWRSDPFVSVANESPFQMPEIKLEPVSLPDFSSASVTSNTQLSGNNSDPYTNSFIVNESSNTSSENSADAMFQVNTLSSFANLTGSTNQPAQMNQTQMLATSTVFAPQQIQIANQTSTTALRREEALVRQESELARRVDNQSIENTELRDSISRLRQEMTTMANQNAQLLPTLQGMMKSRGVSTAAAVSDDDDYDDLTAEAVIPGPTDKTSRSRSPASIPRSVERTGNPEGIVRNQSQSVIGQSAGVNIPQDARGAAVVNGQIATSANVGTNPVGARASAGLDRLVTRFTPSPVSRQALATSSGGAEISGEEKAQMVLEFLDYVKENPLYRNGAYLSESNDTITLDYGGQEVVVRLDQIPDSQTRSLVQERLISQRMNLNQQMRQARLTELRRLLAEASDGL